jgi:nucleoside-diphosphate-sugar epimerase
MRIVVTGGYGPRFSEVRVPKNLIRNALQGKPTWVPNGGYDKVDYTHVMDAVRGILPAVDIQAPGDRVHNITGGKAYTTAQVGEFIQDSAPVGGGKDRPGPCRGGRDQAPSQGDAGHRQDQERSQLHTRVRHPEGGLAEYVEHLRCHAS